MLGLIILIAIAWSCAKALDSGANNVTVKHKKRMAKAAKKNGRKTGAKLAARAATGATCLGTFLKGFTDGWKREWPKARKRAAERFNKAKPGPEVGDGIATGGIPRTGPDFTTPRDATLTAPLAPSSRIKPPAPAPAEAAAPTLVLIKDPDTRPTTTGGNPMALATIPEVTGVTTLKSAVARFASEANVTAEEAAALAQRAAEQLAAIEAAIEQASALEFGDDGGTLEELYALRDMYTAALGAAQAYQKTALDSAAIASQSSKNIHNRHTNIQEAVAAQGGRMASKQAYTADA